MEQLTRSIKSFGEIPQNVLEVEIRKSTFQKLKKLENQEIHIYVMHGLANIVMLQIDTNLRPCNIA